MNDSHLIGPWLKRFLLEYLISERNLSRNTQKSYRDTFRLLLVFLAKRTKKLPGRLTVEEVSAERVKAFLADLEKARHSTVSTRNQRLAALRSWAQYVSENSPEHVQWSGEICAIRFKKATTRAIPYLEKAELDALLASANGASPQLRRDHALLLFLYNTGARADEAAQVLISDLQIAHVPKRDHSYVTIRGKGNKLRQCPLWAQTAREVMSITTGRPPTDHVFINRRGEPITRFGIRTMVKRHAKQAAVKVPSLSSKSVGPHVLRHTTATHLLRAGVDLNTIRAWLGHVSIDTTTIYAETDLETKEKALALCEVQKKRVSHHWRDNKELMSLLAAI